MQFFEQIQYKLRNFLYEQERARYNKKEISHYKKETQPNPKDEGNEKSFTKMMNSLEEIDTYLEQKVEEWNLKIKR